MKAPTTPTGGRSASARDATGTEQPESEALEAGARADARAGTLRSVPDRYRPILLAAALVLLALLFRQLATLVLAVLITVILAIPLSTAATRLEQLRIPRALGAVLALLLGLVVLGGVLALVVPSLISQVDELVAELPAIGDELSELVASITGSGPNEFGQSLQDSVESYVDEPERLIGPLTSVGLGVVGVVGGLLLIVVTAVLIASRPEPLIEGSRRLVPPPFRGTADRIMSRLRTAYVGWMKGVLVDMAVTAVLLYAGLVIVGLEFALVFAVISALLVVIPYFGSVLGGIPPVLVALAESPSKALLVLVVYLIVQQIEGNVIVPLVMSKAVRLHAAVVAIGVVIVGQLFGIVGLFVAVPILSTVMVLAQELWVKPIESGQAVKQGAGSAAAPEPVDDR